MTSVLIVDDDAQLRRALVRSLRVNGYESGVASSYEEALQCVQQHSYDVVLTDLRMAGKDGIELVGALSERAPLTKAILMSAFASARDSQRALDTGAVDVLCKPFDTVEMLKAVDRAAESRSGFRGNVHGLSLLDMLQMFHCASRSLTLQVAGSPAGFIHMREGELVHAEHGENEGREALCSILQMPAGSLQTQALEEGPRTVAEPFPALLELLLQQLPPIEASGGSPSDILSIVRGGPRASSRVELPPDPPFPDVFGYLDSERAMPRRALSAPPALSEQGETELGIVRDLRLAIPEARGCAVLTLREGGQIHYCGTTVDELQPDWLNAVRALLAISPSAPEGRGVESTQPPGAPRLGELQLGVTGGVVLAKVTRARRCAVAMVIGTEADLPQAWVSMREALSLHESTEDSGRGD